LHTRNLYRSINDRLQLKKWYLYLNKVIIEWNKNCNNRFKYNIINIK
jgi:hypothetical protein